MLNPQWLLTFKTLVDTGHFTQTAERLHMTQPGVTQQVKKLEEACGHALLKREGKRFSLTEQGRLVYQYALQQAADEAHLLEQLSRDDPTVGVCRLACSGALALTLYPALLALQSKHPNLVMQLEVAPKAAITRAVLAGNIDLGLVTQAAESPELDCRAVGREPLSLILPAGAELSGDIAADLLSLGLIRHPDAEHHLALYLAQCGAQALRDLAPKDVPVRGYINQLQQILLPVAQGLGFTVLPHSAVQAFAGREQLQVWPAPQPVSEPLYLLKRRGRELPARFTEVLAIIQRLLQCAEGH